MICAGLGQAPKPPSEQRIVDPMPDPAAWYGFQIFENLRTYSSKFCGGKVPAFDTADSNWVRIYSQYTADRAARKEWVKRFDAIAKPAKLRIRTNPAAVGEVWGELRPDDLVVEAYEDNGEAGCGFAAHGAEAPVPPLNTPLMSNGWPSPFYVRYFDFHHRNDTPDRLGSARVLNVSSVRDRMLLLSQLMDREPTHVKPDLSGASLEIVLHNRDRYLMCLDGSLVGPNNRYYILSHRAFMFIADVLGKYLPQRH